MGNENILNFRLMLISQNDAGLISGEVGISPVLAMIVVNIAAFQKKSRNNLNYCSAWIGINVSSTRRFC